MRLVAQWADPRARTVDYRLVTDSNYYHVERAERDMLGGTRWTLVGTIHVNSVAKQDELQRLLVALVECCAVGTALLEPPRLRTVTSG